MKPKHVIQDARIPTVATKQETTSKFRRLKCDRNMDRKRLMQNGRAQTSLTEIRSLLTFAVQLLLASKQCGALGTNCEDAKPIIYLWLSELCAMAKLAAAWNGIEVGGHIYGDRAGDVTFALLTGAPGPKAQHRVASFTQDLEYCRTLSAFLLQKHDQKLVGRYHSHHRLHLRHPSAGDHATAKSIMEKNRLPILVEIILTTENNGEFVRVDAYVYFLGEPFEARPAQIVVVPGVSPVRTTSVGSVVFPTPESAAWEFPAERILVNGAPLASEKAIPDELVQQIAELPSAVQRGLNVATGEGGAIAIDFPLELGSRACVGYSASVPNRPVAVQVRNTRTGEMTDVTTKVNTDYQHLQLRAVYQWLLEFSCSGNTQQNATKVLQSTGKIRSEDRTQLTESVATVITTKSAERTRGLVPTTFNKAVAGLSNLRGLLNNKKSLKATGDEQ